MHRDIPPPPEGVALPPLPEDDGGGARLPVPEDARNLPPAIEAERANERLQRLNEKFASDQKLQNFLSNIIYIKEVGKGIGQKVNLGQNAENDASFAISAGANLTNLLEEGVYGLRNMPREKNVSLILKDNTVSTPPLIGLTPGERLTVYDAMMKTAILGTGSRKLIADFSPPHPHEYTKPQEVADELLLMLRAAKENGATIDFSEDTKSYLNSGQVAPSTLKQIETLHNQLKVSFYLDPEYNQSEDNRLRNKFSATDRIEVPAGATAEQAAAAAQTHVANALTGADRVTPLEGDAKIKKMDENVKNLEKRLQALETAHEDLGARITMLDGLRGTKKGEIAEAMRGTQEALNAVEQEYRDLRGQLTEYQRIFNDGADGSMQARAQRIVPNPMARPSENDLALMRLNSKLNATPDKINKTTQKPESLLTRLGQSDGEALKTRGQTLIDNVAPAPGHVGPAVGG